MNSNRCTKQFYLILYNVQKIEIKPLELVEYIYYIDMDTSLSLTSVVYLSLTSDISGY